MYERLKELCEQKGTTITRLCIEATGNSGNLQTWKNNNGHMRSDYLLNCAKILGVSTDFLLTGEKQSIDLTELQKEMIKKFSRLPEKEQYKILGKIELILEQQNDEDLKTVDMLSDLDNITKSNNKIKTNI